MIDFDDSLDDLLGGPMVPSDRPKATPPESYRAKVLEPCAKCGGRGRFISYAGRDCGPCFSCKGRGKREFVKSAGERARDRERAGDRKAAKIDAAFEAFKAREPAVWEWLGAAALRNKPFKFAVSLYEALGKYGDLTDGQLAAVHKLMARDAERAAERARTAADAPIADAAGVDRLKAAFDHAAAYAAARGRGIRRQRITLGDAVISPAPAGGRNPGALYVKSGETYLGKVASGRFYASQDCDGVTRDRVLAFIADPKAAAEAYGQETGTCCICNALLTDPNSIARGIGPICAEKFGWGA